MIILGPALFGAVLILLPLVAGKGERSPLRRPWSLVIVAFIVFMISYYGHMGHVAQGAKVFHDKGCEYCHMIADYGGVRGPNLRAGMCSHKAGVTLVTACDPATDLSLGQEVNIRWHT